MTDSFTPALKTLLPDRRSHTLFGNSTFVKLRFAVGESGLCSTCDPGAGLGNTWSSSCFRPRECYPLPQHDC